MALFMWGLGSQAVGLPALASDKCTQCGRRLLVDNFVEGGDGDLMRRPHCVRCWIARWNSRRRPTVQLRLFDDGNDGG